MAEFDDVTVALFWGSVSKEGPVPPHKPELGRCWEWTGSRVPRGYGYFKHVGRGRARWRAHRYSWVIAHGPIPDGIGVLHHCDNPPCVNPTHLFLGTQADNVHDMIAKGRRVIVRGRDRDPAGTKLDEAAVRKIRELREAGMPAAFLARRFKVSRPYISRIANRTAWAHVE